MLERETDLILQLLTERTIGPRDAITLKEVLSAPIPKNIKKYVQCEVVRWLSSDLHSTPSFSHILAKTKAATAIMESMLQSLAPEYTFDRKEFLITLENGVHFLENYLCRPHWTLEHFLFEKEERVTLDSLLTNLEYFTDYSYLRNLIERATHIKGWTEINRDAFRSLVERIDEQVVSAHSAYEMALLTKPIYDFLCLEDAPVDRAIPLKPLLVFFDDKKMKIVKEQVERAATAQGQSELSLAGLGKILDSLHIGETSSSAESEHSTHEPLDTTGQETLEQTDGSESPADSEAINSMEGQESRTPEETTNPLSQERVQTTEIESSAFEAFDVKQSSPESPRPLANPMLSLTFAGLKETQRPLPRQTRSTESIGRADGQPDARLNADGGQGQAGGLASLYDLISQEQKEQFVEKMFKKDDAYYAGIITALNKTSTWKEASLYLNELYQTNGLDPFTDEVVEFTDIIHSRYSTPDKDPE